MPSALAMSPVIGIALLLCHPASAMRSEKDFLERPWTNALNETIEHVPLQPVEPRSFIATNRITPLDVTSSSVSQSTSYTTQFTKIPETFRTPDRHLFTARISDKSTGETFYVGLPSRDELRAFQWSRGTAYSFVLDDEVYYVPSPEKQPIRVSTAEGGFLHGTFDWVYNEEIFGRAQVPNGAMWFSKSDKYLAYASRAANSSKEMMITTYTKGEKYDYNYNLEYPKTGEPRLATFSVSIWSIEEQKSTKMNILLRDNTAFHYLFGASWVTLHGKELLLTTWANRWQNETSLTLCSYETATCSLIYEHKYEEGQWATPEDYANIIHSNSSVFIILPENMGDNAWQHVAKIEITADLRFQSISFLPSGEYDIKEVVTYRREENLVFYRAQAPQPWNIHVYATAAWDRSVLKADKCLTCLYPNCTFQETATVSQGDQINITVFCKGPGQPHNATISFDKSLRPMDTAITTATTGNSTQPEWTIDTLQLTNGYEANFKIYEGDSQLASVPVTLVVYGGPNSNKVTDLYEQFPKPIGYKHAIVYIDVRGSGARGWKYRTPVFGRLVTVEVEDTIEAMKLVLAKYPRLDKSRVGVYGWSYGGTMTTRLVEKAPEGFFKCALAGAPVTNFINYDATYTERVMADTPRSSFTDLTLDVSKFNHTQFMLVHGLRDDNVHFQHSALLIEKLQQATIPFQLMVYPNQAHAPDESVNKHLQLLQDSFFDACYAK